MRYAALAVPLAFVGLPIYVHIPKFYAQLHGMNLAVLGAVLLVVRLADCFFDPFIGMLRDRYPAQRRRMMLGAALLLAVGYAGLFNPPALDASALVGWLVACLVVVYFSFSVVMIHYYAAGVGIGDTPAAATRVSAYRETGMLIGVLLASLLPALLTAQFGALSYRWLAGIFALILLVGVWVTLRLPLFRPAAAISAAPMRWDRFMVCLRDAPTRYVLWVLLLNSIPSAITGTLFLFFTADVLHTTDLTAGLLLVLYFISAAVAIPLWMRLSKHLGLRRTLAVAMVLAVVSFIFAYGLGQGDVVAFAIICAVSGAAVGADLAVLPAMFAHALRRIPDYEGVGFGLWHFTNKLTLALAAGLALPLLAWAGYVPSGGSSITVLSLAYAAIPCLIKLGALAVLMIGARTQQEFP